MKIAITGHKHGIGKAFAEQLSARGHEIIGISRSDGENIRRVTHTASLIEPADLFINNAQSNYAQTELLYEVWKRWNLQRKWIWNISTMMTEEPIDGIFNVVEKGVSIVVVGATTEDGKTIPLGVVNKVAVPEHNDFIMSQYRNQKLALEEASRQLRYKSSGWPKISVIRPGDVATQGRGGEDVDVWVKSVIDTFTQHDTIHISEISISHINHRIPI